MKIKFPNTKAIISYLITALVIALLNVKLSYADILDTQTPILPNDMVKKLGSGIDVTWSEVPSKIDEYTTQATIEFANKGFKHFRLRVANDDVAAITAFLDQQIQDSLDNGVIPIIANQSHSFEDHPTAETQAAWVKWWGDMAEHYKDYPYEVMFDLIIEIASRSALSDEPVEQLNEAYEQAVTAIRATGGYNAERIIIFSAHKRSDPTKLHLLDIPTQGNGYLIAEFHEGYASGPSIDPTNPHYYWDGSEAEIKLMSDRADAAVTWSNDTGIPIWEGAWMPGNYNKGDDYDIERQIKFLTDFIKVLNDRKIPHAVNATKKFYDVATNKWTALEPVVDAIIALSIDLSADLDTDEENQAPVWSNTTFTLANVEQDTNYMLNLSAKVSDVENYAITFAKISGPEWLTVSSAGIISGTPSAVDVGDNEWVISATDGENNSGINSGNIVNANFFITVTESIKFPPPEEEPVNTAPTFVSAIIEKAAITVGQGIAESLSNDAMDEQSNLLIYKKVSGPSWLSIAETGDLSGIAGAADVGLNSFVIEVSDEGNLTDSAILELEVIAIAAELPPAAPIEPVVDKPAIELDQSSAGNFSFSLFCLLLCLLLRKTTFRNKLF